MKLWQRQLAQVVIGIGSILLAFSLVRTTYGLWKKQDYVRAREEAYRQAQKYNQELKNQLKIDQTPDFVEKVAREKLGMGKEGETVIFMPNSSIANTPVTNSANALTETEKSNWKKWWGVFF
jgi:cell division protein FtsB